MIHGLRTFACILLTLHLIASGAETQRKRSEAQSKEEATPSPRKKKPTTTAASKDEEDTSSATPKPKPKLKRKTEEAEDEGAPTEKKKPQKAESPKAKSGESEPENKPRQSSSSSSTSSSSTGQEKIAKPKKAAPAADEKETTSLETSQANVPRGMLGPVVATLSEDAIAEFKQQPAWLQTLIHDALALTQLNLGYLFGSADPQAGGMDCSGTVYYLLQKAGYKDVPRDSGGQYEWLELKGTLRMLDENDAAKFDSRGLRPGDLLFWKGTYAVSRENAISHVMLFLGTEKATGKPVMWGASDGRSYDGKQRFGVSVFDFKLPRNDSSSKFVGFGQLPTPAKR